MRLSPSEITSEALWRDRRHFVGAALGALAASSLPSVAIGRESETPNTTPNTFDQISRYNNYYEFSTNKEVVWKLAKVFRAKVLDAVTAAGLTLPDKLPSLWVVDCKCLGDGSQALRYLGRYLYRGVIQEADILSCKDGLVTFRYRDAKTAKSALRTLPGADFLWLVLQHVLPRGLRRSRNFGFLHPNSAKSIRLLQVLHLRAAPSVGKPTAPLRAAWRCVCGQPMRVICRRMPAQEIAEDSRAASSHTPPGLAPITTHNSRPGADRTASMH